MASAPHPGRRKKVLVDPEFQLSVARPLLAVLTVLALVHLGTTWLMSTLDPVEGPDSGDAVRLGLLVSGGYFALVLVAALVTIVHQTQRVAGPAMVIERALRALSERDYEHRLALRDGDHLQAVAAAGADLQRHLAREQARRQEFLVALNEALSAGDLARARALAADAERAERPGRESPSPLRRSA